MTAADRRRRRYRQDHRSRPHPARDAVTALAKAGMTMVIVTHQMVFAQHLAHRAVFMDEGQIVEIAPPAELIAHPRQERTRKFMGQILYGISPTQSISAQDILEGRRDIKWAGLNTISTGVSYSEIHIRTGY